MRFHWDQLFCIKIVGTVSSKVVVVSGNSLWIGSVCEILLRKKYWCTQKDMQEILMK